MNEPTLVTNWTQFTTNFGGFMPGSYLAHACTRTSSTAAAPPTSCASVRTLTVTVTAKPARAELMPAPADGGNAPKGYAIEALEGGTAGDQISVEIADASEPADDNFKLIVKQNGREAEVFDNVTTRKGANNVVTKVKAESKLITIEETKGSGALAVPPKGSFALSGGEAPVCASIA